jgi:hypothetical protein
MPSIDTFQAILIAGGAFMMFSIVVRAINQGAMMTASEEITVRRAAQKRRREEDAAAEAAGRAAGLEPLNLNPDGSVEEPILAEVEAR